MTIAISYPFDVDALGVLKSTQSIQKIYLDRLLTLLSTNPGQRPGLPEYGTDVLKALFENDNNLQISIRQAIQLAVAKWLPEISIDTIDISPTDSTGVSNVSITAILPNSTITTLSVNTSIFNIDGSITEVR